MILIRLAYAGVPGGAGGLRRMADRLASSGRPGDAIEVFMTEGVGPAAVAVAG